jgi:Peptidase inhibitor family I36
MYSVSIARRTSLSALVALALFAGALFAGAPKASASMSQCPSNSVCIWSGSDFSGEFSHWPASESGCHNHSSFLAFRSGWNNTGKSVNFGDAGSIPSGESFYVTGGEPSYTGEICW